MTTDLPTYRPLTTHIIRLFYRLYTSITRLYYRLYYRLYSGRQKQVAAGVIDGPFVEVVAPFPNTHTPFRVVWWSMSVLCCGLFGRFGMREWLHLCYSG